MSAVAECGEPRRLLAAVFVEVVAEALQPRQAFAVLRAVRGLLDRNDVLDRTDGTAVDFSTAPLGVLEAFDAVWREYQINVKGSVFQLYEVLPALDIGGLLERQSEAELLQGFDGSQSRDLQRDALRAAGVDAGRLVFGIFAALAEFERELTRERTLAGLAAARARGRNGGRTFALSKAQVRGWPRPRWRTVTRPCPHSAGNSGSTP